MANENTTTKADTTPPTTAPQTSTGGKTNASTQGQPGQVVDKPVTSVPPTVTVTPSPIALAFSSQIQDYMSAMSLSKTIPVATGTQWQTKFYSMVMTTLDDPLEMFKDKWAVLEGLFKTHADGVFAPQAVFRFSNTITSQNLPLDTVHAVIDFLLMASPTIKRAGQLTANGVSSGLLSKQLSDTAKRNLSVYYKL